MAHKTENSFYKKNSTAHNEPRRRLSASTRTVISGGALLPLLMGTLLLTGCGAGDKPRMTKDSPNLSGLWRVKMDGDTDQIDSELGFSFTLVDNGGTANLVACAGRSAEALAREGNVLTPLFSGDATIINNDTLSSSNEYGDSEATKMSVNPVFDMGKFSFQSTPLGNLTTTDVCTNTITAKYLGISALDTVTVYTRHRGTLFAMELSKVGKFSQATYPVGTEVTQVSVALESELLKSAYKDTRVTLTNGTLTISKSSNVWLNGEVSARLPDGQLFTGQFELEKP